MADTDFPPAIESPLVVVSNRGPVTFERSATGGFQAERGAGGLVTTLSGVFYRDEATWVSAAMSEADREVPRRLALDEATDLRLRFVSLDPKVYDGYYNGISNGILWFTHHFLWDIARTPVFDESTDDAWRSYEEANRAFADALDGFPHDAVFLIQDYQLALVPMYLREHRPDARIIHFSHTPFAGQTYLRLLPIGMRESLLRGMAAADVIGFQSRTWAENFLLSARGLAGAKPDLRRSRLTIDGRTSLVRTFPVSVGAEGLRAIAATPQVQTIRDEITASLGDQRLLLRVDRLEPSKNILRGYLAYELFLRRNPGWRGRVRFLSLLTPSREELTAYREYGDACLAEAHRINTELGHDGWAPIVVRLQHDMDYAVAAYSLYDALLVNPVYDGMNLVAMEGPVVNRRGGVLVLSRNAGAYGRLGRHAVPVNPFDVRETADAIQTALEMHEDDRLRRARGLSRTVLAHTPAHWLAQQLEMLDRAVRLRTEDVED
jgi:trehalose 6-phosphate synthase